MPPQEPLPGQACCSTPFKSSSPAPARDSDVSWKVAGGGLTSNIRDLALYCQALMDDTLLSAELKRRTLFAPHIKTPDRNAYGYGFYVEEKSGRRLVQHDGLQAGARSLLRLYPEDKLCYVMLTNTDTVDPYPISRRVEEIRLAPIDSQ